LKDKKSVFLMTQFLMFPANPLKGFVRTGEDRGMQYRYSDWRRCFVSGQNDGDVLPRRSAVVWWYWTLTDALCRTQTIELATSQPQSGSG